MAEPRTELQEGLSSNVESLFQDFRNNPNGLTFDTAFKAGLKAMGLEEYADAITEKAKALSAAGRYSYEQTKKLTESANESQLQFMNQIVGMNINFEHAIADSKIGVVGFFEKAITFVRAIDEMFFGGTLSDTLDSFEDKLDVMKENIQNELSQSETRINDSDLARDVVAQEGRVMNEARDINTRETGSFANGLASPIATAPTASNTGFGNNDMQITKIEFTRMAGQSGMTPAQIDSIDFDSIAGSDNNNVVTGHEGALLIGAMEQAGIPSALIENVGAKIVNELKPVGP